MVSVQIPKRSKKKWQMVGEDGQEIRNHRFANEKTHSHNLHLRRNLHLRNPLLHHVQHCLRRKKIDVLVSDIGGVGRFIRMGWVVKNSLPCSRKLYMVHTVL